MTCDPISGLMIAVVAVVAMPRPERDILIAVRAGCSGVLSQARAACIRRAS
jgi:hypothetical protein